MAVCVPSSMAVVGMMKLLLHCSLLDIVREFSWRHSTGICEQLYE